MCLVKIHSPLQRWCKYLKGSERTYHAETNRFNKNKYWENNRYDLTIFSERRRGKYCNEIESASWITAWIYTKQKSLKRIKAEKLLIIKY